MQLVGQKAYCENKISYQVWYYAKVWEFLTAIVIYNKESHVTMFTYADFPMLFISYVLNDILLVMFVLDCFTYKELKIRDMKNTDH